MDMLRELGALALGSRLKRLSDQLMQDGIKVYRDAGLVFEPKWFPVYYYLSHVGPSAVTDIARGLGISHPSVNQVAKEMMAAGLIAAYKDTKDKRKRVLALTGLGKAQRESLAPVWRNINGALQELIDETQVDMLGYIETLERALAKKDFHTRFLDRHQPVHPGIDIVTFDARYAEAFKSINEEWIVEYFELEHADRKMINDPAGYVIKPGGEILFALDNETGAVLGTCALINHGEGVCELAKMGVPKAGRGRGVGKFIAHAAVKTARAMGFVRLYLETNSRLAPALGLYRQLGFIRKPSPFASDYARADVYMEMDLH